MYEAPRLFAYTWRDSHLRWDLSETASGTTRIVFNHFVMPPQFLVGLAAGWHDYLDRLEAYLIGVEVPDRFDQLLSHYDNLANGARDEEVLARHK